MIARFPAGSLMLLLTLSLAGCSSTDKEKSVELPSDHTSAVALTPGEAGGAVVDTYTCVSTITDIDRTNRRLTLTGRNGDTAVFKAGPEIRNFDQLQVGDRVKATAVEQVVVFVRHGNESPSLDRSSSVSLALRGTTPGVVTVDAVELVAIVKSIDQAKRQATLQFPEGKVRTVDVRPDVKMENYHVGDSVVIRVTSAVAVLVEKL